MVLCPNSVIRGLDDYVGLNGPPDIPNLHSLVSGFPLFLFGSGKLIQRLVKG